MTTGTGTDIVSVARVARLIEAHGSRFLERWFTADEIAYCTAKVRPSQHFAARLAAKEAVLKALPCPWDGPLPWRSIEIRNGERGVPGVRLAGELGALATRTRVHAISVSLSHCEDYATAVAVATSSG